MDWKTLIAELQASGLTQAQIGEAMPEPGKSQTWVADVLSGRYDDLKWTDGQALIALHRQHCGRRRAIA
jgi:hypothetical protein